MEWLFWVMCRRKEVEALCIIWANTLLKSAPPRLHNWRSDKLVIMLWNEQWQRVDWRADAGVTPSLTLGALQAAVVSHGAEELKDEDGDSHHRQAHHKHHHPHRRAVGLCNTQTHTCKYQMKFLKFACRLWGTTLSNGKLPVTAGLWLKVKKKKKLCNPLHQCVTWWDDNMWMFWFNNCLMRVKPQFAFCSFWRPI